MTQENLLLREDGYPHLPEPEVTDNGAVKAKLVANMIRYTSATKRQAKAIVDGCFDGDSAINISDLKDTRNPYAEIEALRQENAQLKQQSDRLNCLLRSADLAEYVYCRIRCGDTKDRILDVIDRALKGGQP